MNSEQFASEYMGSFEVDTRLYDLGRQYHNRCDAFDDAHLTGPIATGGGVLPANHHEHALMARNAREVRLDVIRLGAQMGYTKEQVEEAIRTSAGESVE